MPLISYTYCVLFLSCKLAGTLEVDSKEGEFTFVIFAGVLNCINVEQHGESVHRKNDLLCFAINIDLLKSCQVCDFRTDILAHPHGFNFLWQTGFALVTLELFPSLALLVASTSAFF